MGKHSLNITVIVCFTVIIPTVVAMMWPSIDPVLGWALIIVFGGIGAIALLARWRMEIKQDDIIVPDLRAYNDPRFIQALTGRDRQKLLSLLASGQLTAWARPMAPPSNPSDGRDSDLMELDPKDWPKLHIEPQPTARPEMKGYLTFLQRSSDRRAVKYDLHLSNAQFSIFWPQNGTLIGIDFGLWKAFLVTIIGLAIGCIAMSYPQWKHVAFPPIEPSLGIEDAVIRPFPQDTGRLEMGLFFKNVSNEPLFYRVHDFTISVAGQKRLSLARKGNPYRILPSMDVALWFSPFDEGANETKVTRSIFDVVIEYGATEYVYERTLAAKFSCDLVLGKQTSTDCMREKEVDERIP